MDQTIQTFRELLEQNTQQTYATMSEFVRAVEDMLQNNSADLEKTLRGMENFTNGQRSATQALNANVKNELHAIMDLKDVSEFFKESLKRFNQNTVKTLERDDSVEIANLAKHLKVNESELEGIIVSYCNKMEDMKNKQDLYLQAIDKDQKHFEQLSPFEKLAWNMQRWGVAFEQNRKDFLKDVSNYQNQFGVNREVALKAVQKDYIAKGIPTAEFLNPAGQPGGSAAMATERQKFIKQLVAGITNSALGKKIMNVAAEGASMAALAMASTAPPWLQKTILMAIYLGVPQAIMSGVATLPSAILNLMSTRFGRMLLSGALSRIAGLPSASAGLISRMGMISKGVGPYAFAPKAGVATAAALGTKFGLNVLSTGIDMVAGEHRAGANIAKMILGGLTVAGAFLLAPIIGPVAAIGVGIAGLWHAFQHFWKWYDSTSDHPKWLDALVGWWQDHMPEWLGGKGQTDENGGSAKVGFIDSFKDSKEQVGTDLLGHKITSGFGYRIHPEGTGSKSDGKKHFHTGVDLAYKEGENVSANVGGTIVQMLTESQSGGYGNMMVVKDEKGALHKYAHLQGFGDGLQVGGVIKQGDSLGKAGHTGFATGPHVHYEVEQDGKKIDPVEYNKKIQKVKEEIKKENKKEVDLKNRPMEITASPTNKSGTKDLARASLKNVRQ